MNNDKFVDVLNVSAFSEGFFTKCASLGVPPGEAYEYLVKSANVWSGLGKALGIGGGALTAGKMVYDAGKGAASDGMHAVNDGQNFVANTLQNYASLLGGGLTAGAGVGGLGWLMNQNARNEAKREYSALGANAPSAVDSQVAELQKAFAPAAEEKVKRTHTAAEPSYEV